MKQTAAFTVLRVLLASVTWLSLCPSMTVAQTLPSGVINAPPTVVGDFESIGADTILNVLEGGTVGAFFNVLPGGELNVSGGTVGNYLGIYNDTVVNISGGTVGIAFDAFGSLNISGGFIRGGFSLHSGSEAIISGGTIAHNFDTTFGSASLVGGEFLLNGISPVGDTVSLSDTDVLTGTLQDGSVFLFTPILGDSLVDVSLINSILPINDTIPMIVSGDTNLGGLRQGQSLTLLDGSRTLKNFAVVGGTLNVDGGLVEQPLDVADGLANITGGVVGTTNLFAGSVLHMSDGVLGSNSNAHDGSSVNIEGGTLGGIFDANSGSEIVISGGMIGSGFNAFAGSRVDISGGTIYGNFEAFSESEVNIAGGTYGRDFNAYGGSDVSLYGGEFLVNGQVPASSQVIVNSFVVLTGTLEDGSVFVFSREGAYDDGVFNLVDTTVPPVDTTPITVDGDNAPSGGLRPGQTLNLQAGGAIRDNFSAVGATLNIIGGAVGADLEVAGSTLTMSGGTIGAGFFVHDGSVVNILGGDVGENCQVLYGGELNIAGGTIGEKLSAESRSVVNITGGSVMEIDATAFSEVNISGGAVGTMQSVTRLSVYARRDSVVNVSGGTVGRLSALLGSEVNISGGEFGRFFDARSGGVVNISGGVFGQDFKAPAGSDVRLIGGDFLLNGVTPVSSNITLTGKDVLAGTLEDGSTFVFSKLAFDDLTGVTLINKPLPPVGTAPIIVNTTVSPRSLRPGQTLLLQEGGVLPEDFPVVGATLNISGGTVGAGFEAASAQINISGGVIDNNFEVYVGSVVNISGGVIESRFDAHQGSVVNISGGSVRDYVAVAGSEVNVSGGDVTGEVDFAAYSGSVINVTGGAFDAFDAFGGSEVNLVGTEFDFLGPGPSLDSLIPGQPFTITDRDLRLRGKLFDGSRFVFDLNSTNADGADFFSVDATLTVMLAIAGDFNLDGDVDGDDFLAWQRGESPDPLSAVDLADWRENFGVFTAVPEGLPAVPEPSSILLAALAAFGLLPQQGRRR